jgi:SWI/SNF-related matrix-associated actin-dependent regulator of chromatin subfamily A-like protein 1
LFGVNLYPFQQEGVEFLIRNRNAYLGDDMGLGKTAQALSVVRWFNDLSPQRVLVICPAPIKSQWVDQARMWCPELADRTQIINKGKDLPDRKAAIVIVNYDLAHKEELFWRFQQQHFTFGIADEAHRLKTPDAKRTRYILEGNGLLSLCSRRVLLSGTPMRTGNIDLYTALRAMAPQRIAKTPTWEEFAIRYCGACYTLNGFEFFGPTHVEEFQRILAGFLLRREKDEVKHQLPDKEYQLFSIPLTAKLKSLIEQDYLHGRDDVAGVRQAIALAKMPIFLQHLDDVLEEKEKVVVYAYHHSVIDELASKLTLHGIPYVIFQGGLTDKQRNERKQQFINGPARVFIGQITAAGEGLDGLQEVCDTCLFLEWTFIPADIHQAVDRLHRFGQKSFVLAHFFAVDSSLEYAMIKIIQNRENDIKMIYGKEVDKNQIIQLLRSKTVSKKQLSKGENDVRELNQPRIISTRSDFIIPERISRT